MDDSLTDMQWLQTMDAGIIVCIIIVLMLNFSAIIGSDFPGLAHNYQRMGGKGGRGGSKDTCRKKLEYSSNSKKDTNKPPLSYASLIALAICSTPQRMMTLSSIYRWIEYTFPFYRTPEAKAWKVSVKNSMCFHLLTNIHLYDSPIYIVRLKIIIIKNILKSRMKTVYCRLNLCGVINML